MAKLALTVARCGDPRKAGNRGHPADIQAFLVAHWSQLFGAFKRVPTHHVDNSDDSYSTCV